MRHRKFLRLSSMLGSELLARGVLEVMWDGAYESGDDRLGTADDLELVVRWSGERGALSRALIECGFVDALSETDLRVHDLWHHAPEYVRKRRAREVARIERVAPSSKRRSVSAVRRSVSAMSQQPSGSDCTPSPSPSPAPTPSPTPEEHKSVSSVPAVAVTEPAVMTFPVVGSHGSEWALTQAQMAEWVALFPNLDVPVELRSALAWARANPSKRKTAGGMPRFLASWLTRATNGPRGSPTVAPFRAQDKGSRSMAAGDEAIAMLRQMGVGK